MKKFIAAFLAMVLLIGAGLGSSAQGTKPATQKTVATLIVKKANYGDLNGTSQDVTDKVRTMVKNGTLRVIATDSNLGVQTKVPTATIIRAVLHGSITGDHEITDTVKDFVDMQINVGGDPVTFYYTYGDGRIFSTNIPADGKYHRTVPQQIKPASKLRVDFTLNGVDNSKTVNQGDTMTINIRDNTGVQTHNATHGNKSKSTH